MTQNFFFKGHCVEFQSWRQFQLPLPFSCFFPKPCFVCLVRKSELFTNTSFSPFFFLVLPCICFHESFHFFSYWSSENHWLSSVWLLKKIPFVETRKPHLVSLNLSRFISFSITDWENKTWVLFGFWSSSAEGSHKFIATQFPVFLE